MFPSVVFSPDGQTLASTVGRSIYLWDPVSGQHKYSIFRHIPADVAFSPDGQTLASGGEKVILWDPVTRHQKMILSGSGDVAFSPDGQMLATGNKNGPIHLWDPNTGKLQKTLTLLPLQVTLRSTASYSVQMDKHLLLAETGSLCGM